MTWALAFLFQDGIDFRTDLGEALVEARRKKSCVLIVFFQPGCPHCARLERESLSAPEVAARHNRNFVNVKLARADRAVSKKYAVEVVPAVVLADWEGEVLFRLDGYVPASDYSAWLGTAEGLARHPAAVRGTSRDAAEYRAIGDVFARAGHHDRAVGFFGRAAELALKPRLRGEALAAKGVSHYLNRGGTEELDKVAAAVLALDPEGRLELRDNGLLLQALSEATKGRWIEAMSAVDEALRLAPEGDARDGLLYLRAYYVWKGEGKPAEARRIYEEILENHPETLFRRAVEELLKGLR